MLVDERDFEDNGRPPGAQHLGSGLDDRSRTRRADEVQREVGRRDPPRRGRARRQAAADHVDERGERAGAG